MECCCSQLPEAAAACAWAVKSCVRDRMEQDAQMDTCACLLELDCTLLKVADEADGNTRVIRKALPAVALEAVADVLGACTTIMTLCCTL